MWGVSELFGAQIAGGIGSVTGGATAISTGISLCAFGPWGIIAGIGLMIIGGVTVAFAVDVSSFEVVTYSVVISS